MEFGKLLIFLGVLLVIAGVIVMLVARTNLPLGRLPGDIIYRAKTRASIFR